MKRLLTLGLMLASAFALTNCAEQLDTPNQENDIIVDVTDHEYGIGDPYIIYIDDVDTKTNYTGGKTVWSEGDKIIVYSKPTGSTEGYVCHGAYTYGKYKTHDSEGKEVTKPGFAGTLKEKLDKTNDWFFVYNGSDSENVTLQPSTNQDPEEEGMKYVMENCPLWGLDNRVSKKDNPRFKMKYPYAVAAIEITNNTPGNIVVASAGIKATEDIVGEFTIDNSGKLTKINGKTSSTATTTIKNAPISSANTQTFYMPVKPFTAAAGKKLTVYVNGSYRDITLEKELKFEAGKITTISVPVLDYSYNAQTKEGHPYESDVFGKTSQGRVGLGWDEKTGGSFFNPTYTHYDDNTYGPYEIFSLNNCDSLDVVINGKTCKAYVVGGNSTTGSIVIRGFAKDLINALPIGFYASRYNDTPTAMTIDYVNAWVPEYNGTISKDYSKLQTRKDLSFQYGDLAGLVGFDLVAGKGVTRDLIVNKLGIAASTITFNGIVSNGNFDNNNVVILDENPVYKEVSEKKVEEYLKKFGNDASLQGLKDILNSEFPEGSNTIQWSTEAENTGKAIYDKVYSVLERKAGSLTGAAMLVVGFADYKALMYKMRDMRFEICIKTYPYAAKYTTTDLTSPLAPIVFWGFDAYGTDRSAPAN